MLAALPHLAAARRPLPRRSLGRGRQGERHADAIARGAADLYLDLGVECTQEPALSEWGQTFADPRVAAAVVVRLTFRAHIIETGSES